MRQKDSVEHYFGHELHVEERLLWVGSQHVTASGVESGTDASMSERLIKGLNVLQTGPNKNKPIRIQMSNFGGYWHHGIAMYDAIRACRAKVTMEVFGPAMSMGSIILQAADVRLLHPMSKIMIHDGQDGFWGHARNFEAAAVESKRLRKEMYEIYAERSGKPVEYWEKKCMVDYYLSAEEAVAEGLADKILPPVKVFKKKT